MGRVARALVWHEFRERIRDRWVLLISILFALLASGVSLYGRSAEMAAAALIGPSMVTLISLFVPLVALVLGHDAIVGERERNTLGLLFSLPVHRTEIVLAKFLGRSLAMVIAISVGLCVAILLADASYRPVLVDLIWPTILLGGAFLSLGLLLSSLVKRQVMATSLVVATWFLLVFFYDLALLGLLVITEGNVSETTVTNLVVANPAGLFRLEMLERFSGEDALQRLGMSARLPEAAYRVPIWAAWIALPLAASAAFLTLRKAER